MNNYIKIGLIFIGAVLLVGIIAVLLDLHMQHELSDSDGLAWRMGFSCYRQNMSKEYTEQVIIHEACHHMVNAEYRHFCEGEE
jgi:hypothetical protein